MKKASLIVVIFLTLLPDGKAKGVEHPFFNLGDGVIRTHRLKSGSSKTNNLKLILVAT